MERLTSVSKLLPVIQRCGVNGANGGGCTDAKNERGNCRREWNEDCKSGRAVDLQKV